MSPEITLLHNSLLVGALLLGIGMIGLLSRRNMIVVFLSAELMLQGVSLSLVAFGRFHNDFGAQVLVLFVIAVAACEAAIVLALVLVLFRRKGSLDIAAWQALREADQPPFVDEPLPPEPAPEAPPWPHLAVAGRAPEIPPEEADYRPHV